MRSAGRRAALLPWLGVALAAGVGADDVALEMFEVRHRTAASLVAALEATWGKAGPSRPTAAR